MARSEQRRTNKINLRLNDAELAELKGRAIDAEMSLSAYARHLVINEMRSTHISSQLGINPSPRFWIELSIAISELLVQTNDKGDQNVARVSKKAKAIHKLLGAHDEASGAKLD